MYHEPVIIILIRPLFAVQWPGGTYGLPMPMSGCPTDGITEWKTGWTYHDTEDDNNDNQRSNIFHMPGNFSAHGIQQKFCLKVANNGNTGSEIWPEGKYCLYKKGKERHGKNLHRNIQMKLNEATKTKKVQAVSVSNLTSDICEHVALSLTHWLIDQLTD